MLPDLAVEVALSGALYDQLPFGGTRFLLPAAAGITMAFLRAQLVLWPLALLLLVLGQRRIGGGRR